MSIAKEHNRDRSLDKNLQDDWIPDQERKVGVTSKEVPEYEGDFMETAVNAMNYSPIFCTGETRVAEIKHLLKKYDYQEILVVDTLDEKCPIGLVGMNDMTTYDVEQSDFPSDVSAIECMRKISATVNEETPLEDCMNIMRDHHLDRIPVIDHQGHLRGILEKKDVAAKIF